MSREGGLYDRDLDHPYNPYRAPASDVGPVKIRADEYVGYGGFWRRLLAHIIDQIIVFFIVIAISLPFTAVMALLGIGPGDSGGAVIGLQIISTILQFVALIAYSWGMLSSRHQATLGKMAMGLKVTSTTGERITFVNAAGREISKFFSAIILYIGFIMIGFDERKQGLHDKIAKTLVLRTR